MPSLIGGLLRITAFYRFSKHTSSFSHSQVKQCLSHALPLRGKISRKIYKTGYERFRPNKSGCNLDRWYYRGGWHQSYPVLIPPAFYTEEKFPLMRKHSGYLYHSPEHCKSFALAARRSTRTCVSESFSRLPLSRPLLILGLVGFYSANNLISRSPILKPHVSILAPSRN